MSEILEDGQKRSRRATRYSGDFQVQFKDLDSSEDDDDRKKQSKLSGKSKIRTKECPGCGNKVSISTKQCTACDYQFTSKSMLLLNSTQSAAEESKSIRDRFPFEPEREDDGSLIIEAILGRRPRKSGKRWLRPSGLPGSHLADMTATDAKFDYEYLVKYKSLSYLHVQWLSATEIDAMNTRSKKMLLRYLTKIDQMGPSSNEEGEIDPSYLEPERIIDMREEEVNEVIEDKPVLPPATEDDENYVPTTTLTGNKNTSTNEDGSSSSSSTAQESRFNTTVNTTVADSTSTGITTTGGISTDILNPLGEENKSVHQLFQPAERCRKVLEKIWEDPASLSFQEPVDTNLYDDYLDVVEQPMSLRDVLNKLNNGEYTKYLNYKRFQQDMRLIWKNCKTYNLYKSPIWYTAHVFSLMFERLFQAWVISFSDGSIKLDDPLGQPWQSTCRKCLQDDHDDKMMLCDHCDAPFHIYCLRPPLSKVPEEAWICQRCTKWFAKTGARMLSATIEDEARTIAESTGHRKVIRIKKKKYLVKWRGLSYRDCTWELVKDINDDALIAQYHILNDNPPEEPPLTQAEIGIELSKDRRTQLIPASNRPSAIQDMDAVIYAQIRSLHFLKFAKTPPEALLKECGPQGLALTHGYRSLMLLPYNIANTLHTMKNYDIHHTQLASTNDNMDKSVENSSTTNTNTKQEKAPVAELEPDKKVWVTAPSRPYMEMHCATTISVPALKSTSDIDKTTTSSSSSSEKEVKEESFFINGGEPSSPTGRTDSDEMDDNGDVTVEDISSSSQQTAEATGTTSKDNMIIHNTPYDPVREEIVDVMSTMVYCVARGALPVAYPARDRIPKGHHIRGGEIEVCIRRGTCTPALGLKLGENMKHQPVVLGFQPIASGIKSPLELSGRVKHGDILIGIDNLSVIGMKFDTVKQLLIWNKNPYVYLRFYRNVASTYFTRIRSNPSQQKYDPLEEYLENRKEYTTMRPAFPRGLYYGVFPSVHSSSLVYSVDKWDAIVYNGEKSIILGTYSDEKTAALAYDSAVRSKKYVTTGPLNFNEDGSMTKDLKILYAQVTQERAQNDKKVAMYPIIDEIKLGIHTHQVTDTTTTTTNNPTTAAAVVISSTSNTSDSITKKEPDTLQESLSNSNNITITAEKSLDSTKMDMDGDKDMDKSVPLPVTDEEDQQKNKLNISFNEDDLQSFDTRDSDSDIDNDGEEEDDDDDDGPLGSSSNRQKHKRHGGIDDSDTDSDTDSGSDSDNSSSNNRPRGPNTGGGARVDTWDSDDENEWKPQKEILLPGDGPMSRLLRAVNQSDYPPIRSEWNKYIIELGYSQKKSSSMTTNDPRARKIDQIDMASGAVIEVWESVNVAARMLGITPQSITKAILGYIELAGGFKWRISPVQTIVQNIEEDDDEEEGGGTNSTQKKEESWQNKLYKKSNEYRSGGYLRDYQVEGLNWLLRCWYSKRSSILADEMGLGKTVQIITFLHHLYSIENIRGPFLVTVPLSTIEHWKREAEGWSDMGVCLYHDTGGGRDMRDIIREYEWYYKGRSRRLLKFQLLITTYDDLTKDYEELAEIPWRVVVVDEAHRLRNTNSRLLECMRSVVAKGLSAYGYQHRILMTGTPLQNNTQELWSLLNFIEPAKFPDAEKFAARFGDIRTQEQVELLQRRIAPHLLRRVKEDVAKDIPPKEETIIDVELTTMQKQYYRAIFERNHGFLVQQLKAGNLPKLMNIQMELRKCCNHPFLINGIEQTEMENLENKLLMDLNSMHRLDHQIFEKKRMEEILIPTSGKMVLIDKLLPKLRNEKHKVLIFSQMVKMIDIIDEYCEFRGYPCERLDGRVSGNERQKAIDRFNKNENSFIFLLSTRAGGVGINLTAADVVIIFDSDWNPQNDVQAMARCHRIGQNKSVTIYRLITRKSFEAEMFDRASKKLGLEQAVLGTRQFGDQEFEESQKANEKLDAKEMEQLLREGAYAVLLQDNDEEIQEFFAQDIDKILQQRSHVLVTEGGQQTESWLNKKKKTKARKSLFTGEQAMEHAEIDVNDPDFWQKVLPDLVTPDIMLNRLTDDVMTLFKRDNKERDSDKDDDDDEEENEEEEDVYQKAENEEEIEVQKKEMIDKYMKDLSQMMDGMLDLTRRGQLPDRERAVCIKLLLRITLAESIFNEDDRLQVQEWLAIVEGTRRRRGEQSIQQKSTDKASPGGGRGSRGGKGSRSGGKKGGRGSGNTPAEKKQKKGRKLDFSDDENDDEDDMKVQEEEEYNSEEDTGGKRGRKSSTGDSTSTTKKSKSKQPVLLDEEGNPIRQRRKRRKRGPDGQLIDYSDNDEEGIEGGGGIRPLKKSSSSSRKKVRKVHGDSTINENKRYNDNNDGGNGNNDEEIDDANIKEYNEDGSLMATEEKLVIKIKKPRAPRQKKVEKSTPVYTSANFPLDSDDDDDDDIEYVKPKNRMKVVTKRKSKTASSDIESETDIHKDDDIDDFDFNNISRSGRIRKNVHVLTPGTGLSYGTSAPNSLNTSSKKIKKNSSKINSSNNKQKKSRGHGSDIEELHMTGKKNEYIDDNNDDDDNDHIHEVEEEEEEDDPYVQLTKMRQQVLKGAGAATTTTTTTTTTTRVMKPSSYNINNNNDEGVDYGEVDHDRDNYDDDMKEEEE